MKKYEVKLQNQENKIELLQKQVQMLSNEVISMRTENIRLNSELIKINIEKVKNSTASCQAPVKDDTEFKHTNLTQQFFICSNFSAPNTETVSNGESQKSDQSVDDDMNVGCMDWEAI